MGGAGDVARPDGSAGGASLAGVTVWMVPGAKE